MGNETLFTDIEELSKFMKANNIYDKFSAVQIISERARILRTAYKDLDEKEAISWVLRGHPSESYERKHKQSQIENKINDKKFDMLSYVDDEDVRKSCEQSIDASIRAKHLIYQYTENVSEDDKARVRIITKITLEQMKQN